MGRLGEEMGWDGMEVRFRWSGIARLMSGMMTLIVSALGPQHAGVLWAALYPWSLSVLPLIRSSMLVFEGVGFGMGHRVRVSTWHV